MLKRPSQWLFNCIFWIGLISAAVFLLSCSDSDDPELISGRYIGVQTFGLGQAPGVFILNVQQSGSALTGTLTPPFDQPDAGIIRGTISSTGSAKEFIVEVKGDIFGERTIRYYGTIDSRTARGRIGLVGCLDPASTEGCITDQFGEFEATRE